MNKECGDLRKKCSSQLKVNNKVFCCHYGWCEQAIPKKAVNDESYWMPFYEEVSNWFGYGKTKSEGKLMIALEAQKKLLCFLSDFFDDPEAYRNPKKVVLDILKHYNIVEKEEKIEDNLITDEEFKEACCKDCSELHDCENEFSSFGDGCVVMENYIKIARSQLRKMEREKNERN